MTKDDLTIVRRYEPDMQMMVEALMIVLQSDTPDDSPAATVDEPQVVKPKKNLKP